MSVIFCWISWNSPIFWPKALRSSAYGSARSRQRCAWPTQRAATEKRPMSSAAPSIGKPWPGLPSTASSGTKASWKCTSARLSRFSVRIGNSPIVMPCVALRIDQERRHAAVLLLAVDRRHHEEEPRVRRVGDEDLGAGEALAAVGARRGGGHVAEVGAAAGLGETRRRDQVAARDRGEPALLLRVVAEAQDRAADQRVRRPTRPTPPPSRRARSPRRSGRRSSRR